MIRSNWNSWSMAVIVSQKKESHRQLFTIITEELDTRQHNIITILRQTLQFHIKTFDWPINATSSGGKCESVDQNQKHDLQYEIEDYKHTEHGGM